MKYFLFIIFILCSCTHSTAISLPVKTENKLATIQNIWEKKDPTEIKKKFPDVIQIAEKEDYYVVGVQKKDSLPSLKFVVDKKLQTIESISFWLVKDGLNNADYIESILVTDDWKKISKENKVKDSIENRIAQFSSKLGVSFIYDELDKKREVWIMYWGADPKVIKW